MAFKDLYGHLCGGFAGQNATERCEEALITKHYFFPWITSLTRFPRQLHKQL